MSARVIDGKAAAQAIRAGLQADIAALGQAKGRPPKLAIVTCAPAAAAEAYLRAKLKAAAETGSLAQAYPCPADRKAEPLRRLIASLSADETIDGIIAEQPLPTRLMTPGAESLIASAIAPDKDVEGMNPLNYGGFFRCKSASEIQAARVFPPCTVSAMIELLRATLAPVAGREAVVVGRSGILGRPAAHYLSALDATVTLCHSRTADLAAHVRRADILFACVGLAHAIKGDWIKPGAVVIDAGMNRLADAWVGDVEFEAAARRAAFISPVPGGVGPVTTAVVLANTVRAAQR